MPRSLEEAQALDATRYLDADIIEWRADYLPKEAILQVAPAILKNSQAVSWFSRYELAPKVEKSTFLQKSISI